MAFEFFKRRSTSKEVAKTTAAIFAAAVGATTELPKANATEMSSAPPPAATEPFVKPKWNEEFQREFRKRLEEKGYDAQKLGPEDQAFDAANKRLWEQWSADRAPHDEKRIEEIGIEVREFKEHARWFGGYVQFIRSILNDVRRMIHETSEPDGLDAEGKLQQRALNTRAEELLGEISRIDNRLFSDYPNFDTMSRDMQLSNAAGDLASIRLLNEKFRELESLCLAGKEKIGPDGLVACSKAIIDSVLHDKEMRERLEKRGVEDQKKEG